MALVRREMNARAQARDDIDGATSYGAGAGATGTASLAGVRLGTRMEFERNIKALALFRASAVLQRT
jgi:hypothetical protein